MTTIPNGILAIFLALHIFLSFDQIGQYHPHFPFHIDLCVVPAFHHSNGQQSKLAKMNVIKRYIM